MTDKGAQGARGDTGRSRRGRAQTGRLLPYRVNVCASLVSQALSRIYAERYKIGVAEWRVLVTLGQFGMMTAKAIGIHSYMHKTKGVTGGRSARTPWLANAPCQSRRYARGLPVAHRNRARGLRYDELAPMALNFARQLLQAVDPADGTPSIVR